MPSFDIVSKTDSHEVMNAVDQTNREVNNRFDFRGTDASVQVSDNTITLSAPSDFQLKQLDEILRNKLAKRNIDIRSIEYKDPEITLNKATQKAEVRQGFDTETAKKIVKMIKETAIKVQAAIQGEQVRVTGKNRDDLQATMAALRAAKLSVPIQFENFRD